MAQENPAGGAVESPKKEKQPWLLMEVWRLGRPYVRDLLVEALIFGGALIVMELFVWGFHRSSLTEMQKAILESLHFWTFFFVLVIFAASFIIQVGLRRFKEAFKENE